MPHCKYRYYVTLLPCNQFHYWGGAQGKSTGLTGGRGPWPPLEPPLIFTEPFSWFELGVIDNVDDGLLISLAVTCDKQHSPNPKDIVIYCSVAAIADSCIKRWLRPSVRPSVGPSMASMLNGMQLEIRADP